MGRRERLPLAEPGGVAMAAPGGAESWGGAGGSPLDTRRRPIALVPGEELPPPTPRLFFSSALTVGMVAVLGSDKAS